ncbi:MAG TPA: hypothetical protein VI997_11020 [Candidatus Thermoplasmatota archaeon]|nr:hypothetical protein [Candidatus Thermoplasmatota archaeon]
MSATRRALLLSALLLAASSFLPSAAARDDVPVPGDGSVRTCGYRSSVECGSFCILGVQYRKAPGQDPTEVCVVPNCACYIGLVTLRHAVLGLRP